MWNTPPASPRQDENFPIDWSGVGSVDFNFNFNFDWTVNQGRTCGDNCNPNALDATTTCMNQAGIPFGQGSHQVPASQAVDPLMLRLDQPQTAPLEVTDPGVESPPAPQVTAHKLPETKPDIGDLMETISSSSALPASRPPIPTLSAPNPVE
ncbi:hypothetical protein EST38_g14238 [Candolleomyces aberdarensis]|uniref:Uncharacterized protein n=1 Tax=Candolleomyces aberdarensis TaxID=2316362 RepID=A0A4V1Q1H6_9AGAR|nr:hypothetical protein EST38_g14238 [Candolleomyces aberdarensis]